MLHYLLLFACIHIVEGRFGASFTQFLHGKYAADVYTRLIRSNLGEHGSFGGSSASLKGEPLVLVHDATLSAASVLPYAAEFVRLGHENGSIYATSYGDGGLTDVQHTDVQCIYILQVRFLIESVAEFTKKKVDVIGYGFGAVIARKAILGGKCIDTSFNIGPSLTSVDTFISVAGPNSGHALCVSAFATEKLSSDDDGRTWWFTSNSLYKACSKKNGMHCDSIFLYDLNLKSHYEGKYVYSIFSRGDDLLGFNNNCGQVTGRVPGQDREFVRLGTHSHVLSSTIPLQHRLITDHD